MTRRHGIPPGYTPPVIHAAPVICWRCGLDCHTAFDLIHLPRRVVPVCKRGQAPSTIAAARGHCKNGHPFDRIERTDDGKTRRICSTCRRETSRRYYLRKKAA